ncbi:hypothetical protein [Variovorax sp. YR216]|uniref:hypothetical protein n=1 Tax=Variovorax sp. YR216 TaxID=1882828 RepID=UPI0008979D06|nr:hypothetical protein [Variovorax sp. YR216]SEA90456.1 hypothetical protein SAMN05444680_104260 [Variovorax sp. YR216]
MERSVLFKGCITPAAALLLAVPFFPDAIGGTINFTGRIVVSTYQVSAPATLPVVAEASRAGWADIGVTDDTRNLRQATARVDAVGRADIAVRCTDSRTGASAAAIDGRCLIGPDGRGLSIGMKSAVPADVRGGAIVTLLYD